MEFLYIVILVSVFISLYLFYKMRNLEQISSEMPTIETFESSILGAINQKFSANMDSISNLSNLCDDLFSVKDKYFMPVDSAYFNDLIIDGSINITNKDSIILNIFPKYMVIAWGNKKTIPLGWAICNGKRYILNDNNVAIENITGELTPDLRGRFILGSGIGKDNNKDMTERKLNDIGGEENHKLTREELAAHKHNMDVYNHGYETCSGGILCLTFHKSLNSTMKNMNTGKFLVETGNTGGVLTENTGKLIDGADKDYPENAIFKTIPHENMPPFYVLMYIMKL